MSLRPVHDLTPDEAVLELEALHDVRPSEDEPLALHHWRQDHQARVDELQAWVLMHQPTPAPEPEPPSTPPEEPTMAPSAPPPGDQLASLLAKLSSATDGAATAPHKKGFERVLRQIYQLRFQVKALVEKHGLEAPALPTIPPNPWAPAKTTKKPSKAVPAEATPAVAEARVQPAPPALLLEPAQPGLLDQRRDLVQSIADVRRSIWLLMADLEKTPLQVRKTLAEELGLLDAAAHAAHSLATGKLETA